jgi:hypothetical protein
MTPRFSYATRRKYAQMSEDNYDEMLIAAEKHWKPCVYALSAAKFLAPICLLAVCVVIATMVAPLPKPFAAVFAISFMVLILISPIVVARYTRPSALKCIESAGLKYLSAKANCAFKPTP